jgi:UDP-glucuronate 4-epimerase
MAPLPFLARIVRGEPVVLYGDGTSIRAYTYIADVVSGILGALERARGQRNDVYNIGGAESVTLNEFVATIEQVTGKRAHVQRTGEQNGDVPVTRASCEAAHRDFGYEARYTLEQGMRLTYAWFQRIGYRYAY